MLSCQKKFWGKALMTVVEIFNRSPIAALKVNVSLKSWSDISYKHLRVFGCGAFVHILEGKRSKLDNNKKKECIF